MKQGSKPTSIEVFQVPKACWQMQASPSRVSKSINNTTYGPTMPECAPWSDGLWTYVPLDIVSLALVIKRYAGQLVYRLTSSGSGSGSGTGSLFAVCEHPFTHGGGTGMPWCWGWRGPTGGWPWERVIGGSSPNPPRAKVDIILAIVKLRNLMTESLVVWWQNASDIRERCIRDS